MAASGEAVVDPGWDDGLSLAVDEAVRDEGLQGLGQHLLADAALGLPVQLPWARLSRPGEDGGVP